MAACNEYEGLIAAAIYGQVEPAERAALDRHLAECAGCRREREELERTARLAGAGAADLAPAERAELADRISRAIAPARAARSRVRPWRGRGFQPAASWRWIAAAAVLLGIPLAFLVTRPARREVAKETAARPPVAALAPAEPAPEPAPAPKPPVPEEKPAPPDAPPPPPPERAEPPPAPPPSPPEPMPPPARESPTVAVIARLERIEGKVFVLSGADPVAVQTAREIASGRGILTSGRGSIAVVKFPDGTRLEVGPDTRIREIVESPDAGKRIYLEKGTVAAAVSRQPAGRPMVLATPEAEARVLGTRFSLATSSGTTRLDLDEGRVRFLRKSDGASIEVAGGQQAVAAEGTALAARPMRSREGLQALYLFQEGRGEAVLDVSGTGLPLDLAVGNPRNVSWKNPGLAVQSPTAVASKGPAFKIVEACRASRELTVEAWIQPARSATDFEGCIVGLSVDAGERNFALVQGDVRKALSLYSAFLRTSTSGKGGEPRLRTPPDSVQPRLTHVAYVRDAAGAERLHMNGAIAAAGSRPGDFSGWDGSYRLVLGNEDTGERPWLGEYRLVAVYSRALRPAEVVRHFKLGID
jgi:hypothetical protein